MSDSDVKVGADFSGLIKGAEDAAKSLAKIGAQVTGIEALKKSFDVLTGAVGTTVNVLAKVGQAALGLEAIGKTGVAMANGLLKGNAALEMTTISFKTLLGSAAAADDMIEQLTKFAASTPFELAGLESQTQRLLAFGFQAKEIVPLMTSMGDAIAALGGTQDNLNSLVYVMGQMRQEAHINAGDIMQMVNLGIPALKILADHYHVTTSEIQQMISKGLIPGSEAVKIFSEGLEKQYGGMMVAQSATFNGMISNLKDWSAATLITLTKPFFEPAKKGLAELLKAVQSPAGEAAVNKLAANIQKGVDLATKAFVHALPSIKAWAGNLEQTYNLIMARFAPGVAGVGNQLEALWKKFQPSIKAVWEFYQAISPLSIGLDVLKGYLTGGVAGALDSFKERMSKLAEYARKGFDLAVEEARKFGPAILKWVTDAAVTLAQQAVVLGEALIEWVAPYGAKLIDELIALAGRVFNWAVTYAPLLAEQMLTWAEAIASWVIPAIPKVLTALLQLSLGVLTWAEQEVPKLVVTMLKWTDAMSGWVIAAIPPLVKSLEQMAGTVANWAVYKLPILIGQIVVGVGNGLGVNLQRPVKDVLNIFYSLVDTIRSTVLPAFNDMIGFLAGNLMPLLDGLSNFIAGTLVPTLGSLAAFAMDVLVPAAVRAAEVFSLAFGPALVLIGSLIRDTLLPALTDAWNYFDGKYTPTIRNLAKQFGTDLAGGIQTAVTKFQESLPALENFYKKIEPIVGKALELYQALSPISIAFDVLSGVLSGGLNGGFEALEQHVIDAGKVFGIDLKPVIEGFSQFVKDILIPNVTSFARDILPKIGEAVGWIADKFGKFIGFLQTDVFPVAKKVFEWVGDKGSKLIGSISDTLETTVLPAIGKFGDWIGNWLWPKLQDVFDWIGKNVGPIFDKGFSILTETVIPTIGDLVNLLLTKVIPTIGDWWGVIATFLQPILEEVGKFINDTFLPAIEGIWKWLDKNLIPKFAEFADFVDKNVLPVLKNIAGFLGGTLGAVFGLIGKIIGGVVDVIGRLAGAFDGIIHADPGKAWDALTGKTNAASDATKDLMKKNDEVFEQLKGVGKTTIEDHTKAIDGMTTKTKDAKGATNDMTKAQDDLIKKLKDEASKVYLDAQKNISDLKKEYDDGKISADKYRDGVQAIQDKIHNYNNIVVAKKDFIANFGSFEAGLDSVIKKLGQVAEKMVIPPMQWQTVGPDGKIITSTTPPAPIKDYPIPGHAAGTMSAARGLALIGERGAELIQDIGGRLMLATSPMLMAMRGGERVFNNQQTMSLLKMANPASPAQIHNMYQNSNASSWDSSSHHNDQSRNTFQYFQGQQLPPKMSYGMMRARYGRS